MPLPRFNVIAPESIKDAVNTLEKNAPDSPLVMAGGTDLIVRMKEGDIQPGCIILLEKIPGLNNITITEQKISIGPMVRFTDIIRSPELNRLAPILVRASQNVGSPQIRNRGTIGGNIANASPCADSVTALSVLEAEIHTVSPDGERTLALEKCFLGPKQNAFQNEEIITRISFSPPEQPKKFFYLASGQRKALAINKLSVAGQLETDPEGVVRKIRIAYGAVGPTVLRGKNVQEFLTGKPLSGENISRAQELAKQEVRPIDDIRSTEDYRRDVTGILLRRGLESIARI